MLDAFPSEVSLRFSARANSRGSGGVSRAAPSKTERFSADALAVWTGVYVGSDGTVSAADCVADGVRGGEVRFFVEEKAPLATRL